ncbi:MAG: stage II sporulation protein M, partial [Bacilli bacterium]
EGMNKLFSKLQLFSIKGRKLYLFLLLIFIIGVVFGSIFITILNEQDKTTVINQIVSFFTQIKANKINYLEVLKNSITSNLIYVVVIWLLGISIIGIPIIIFINFLKGFMIGFSIAAIIAKYKLIGILGSFTYIFPHIILLVLIIIKVSYHALALSLNLLKAIIERKSINFNEIASHYCFSLLISSIIVVAASLIETFVSPYVMKLFTMFI